MRYSRILVSLAAISSLFQPIELNACGDKYLRIALRLGPAYKAEHPATILIYMRDGSVMPGVARKLGLHSELRRRGHEVQAVDNEIDLQRAIERKRYDIVIADGAAGEALAPLIQRGAGRPTFLPAFSSASHRQMKSSGQLPLCLINAKEVALHAVAEIDHVMSLRTSAAEVP